MADGDQDPWDAVAAEWAELWGPFAEPVHRTVIELLGAGPGLRILDVGCGGGDFVAALAATGADASGVDPAPAMLAAARRRFPGIQVRPGSWDRLDAEDGSLDAVTAVNALQFADDVDVALDEVRRALRSGGAIAVASWADAAHNDIDRIEAALAAEAGEPVDSDPAYRLPGGLEELLTDSGFLVEHARLVSCPWRVTSDDALVRGVLLGEGRERQTELRDVVLAAASPFRHGTGYRLENALRLVLARRSAD